MPASVGAKTGHREVDGFTPHKMMLLPSGSQKSKISFKGPKAGYHQGWLLLPPRPWTHDLTAGLVTSVDTLPLPLGSEVPLLPSDKDTAVIFRAPWII